MALGPCRAPKSAAGRPALGARSTCGQGPVSIADVDGEDEPAGCAVEAQETDRAELPPGQVQRVYAVVIKQSAHDGSDARPKAPKDMCKQRRKQSHAVDQIGAPPARSVAVIQGCRPVVGCRSLLDASHA